MSSRGPGVLALAVCAALVSVPVRGAVRVVRAGEDLQQVLNSAQPGDEIRLQAGATFSGNFKLPVKSGTTFITLRSDLPDDQVPGATTRVTPASAAKFARIESGNSMAALRTAAGAHHWRLMLLTFQPNHLGIGDIIELGDGSRAQSDLSLVPHDFVLDRVYVHGSPEYGQKRCISLNASAVTIRNSYVSDCKGAGGDTQAIGGWNAPGQIVIENNHLEAAGEVVLFGGADPSIPNLVTEHVTLRYNRLTRPMSWRNPIISAPTGVRAAAASGGSLPAGTYAYRVVARRPVGQGTTGHSLASAEAAVTISGGAVTVTWSQVSGATEYKVFGRTRGSQSRYWTVTGTSFTDTGGTGTSGTPPSSATTWTVKNLFELKNARDVRVEYNLFENNWKSAQVGYAIVLTPRNQDGGCPWCVVADVVIQHNVVRNSGAGVNILGYDYPNTSRQTRNIQIRDNLLYGLSKSLGGNGWAFLVGEGPRDVVIDRNTVDFDGTSLVYMYGGTSSAPRPIAGFQFTNNATRHNSYGIAASFTSYGTAALNLYCPDGIVRGNWISGASASRYPSGNRFDTPFETAFVSTSIGDYRLVTGSPLLKAATDGGPVGANVAALRQIASTVIAGTMPISSTTGPPPAPKNLRIISSGR
ncbi:MAG TPA: hypothetical protein VF159_08230 [Gemmatimonadaceae bacterium]